MAEALLRAACSNLTDWALFSTARSAANPATDIMDPQISVIAIDVACVLFTIVIAQGAVDAESTPSGKSVSPAPNATPAHTRPRPMPAQSPHRERSRTSASTSRRRVLRPLARGSVTKRRPRIAATTRPFWRDHVAESDSLRDVLPSSSCIASKVAGCLGLTDYRRVARHSAYSVTVSRLDVLGWERSEFS